jgi:hypothetical protein
MTTETNNNAAQILFFYNGIKAAKGAKLERAWMDGSSELIVISAKGYRSFSRAIREAFTVTNESDIMTDYYANDRIQIEPSHPLFAAAYAAVLAAKAKDAERYAKRMTLAAEREASLFARFAKR